jgi:DNA-binding MarR family transcriptional regulator
MNYRLRKEAANMNDPTLITLGEAMKRLGVSNHTVARLVREGYLKTYPNPLDKRQKLVKIDDVERLRRPADLESESKRAA